ncbi:MAG: hypothetical protein EBV16_09880 [Betaproteobacteria bacterium]|nr:hypothetical protein [Betaproteobacteria bacterium]
MHDVICPHCSKAFKIDEAGYADILKQVRDRDFDEQLQKRLALAEQEKRNAVELAKAQLSAVIERELAQKDQTIERYKAAIDSSEMARKLAITEAVQSISSERDSLKIRLEQSRLDKLGLLQVID